MHQIVEDQRLLTAAEERGLARRVHEGNEADATLAANELTLRNLGLVGAAVAWYLKRCPRLDYDDAFSEGLVGLVQASRLYDPDRKPGRFSSYASKSIFNHLSDWLNLDQVVRPPRCSRVPPCITTSLNHDETAARIAPQDPTPGPLDTILNHEDMNRVWSAMARLKPIDSYVLMHRFGLGGHERRTLDSLAAELDLTRDRICQIQKRGVHQLATIFQDSESRCAETCCA
jgi:RNA polymerase sigma factor (sigma-70 family)